MSQKTPITSDSQDPRDQDWDLLARDAAAHPVEPSPWFAARTAALVQPREKSRFALLRWILPLPLPLTALAAMLFVTLQSNHQPVATDPSVASEERFEHNMEMLFASIE